MKKRVPTSLAGLSALLLLAACGGHDPACDKLATEHAAMLASDSAEAAMSAANEAAFRQVFEMFNTGNMDDIANVVAEDFVDHQKDPQITSTGRQSAVDMINMVRTAMPDFHQEWLHAASDGDLYYVHYRMTGTNTGPWGAMPATGKAMDVNGVDIVRIVDGKMAEHWGYMEEMKMMEQMGLMGGEEEKK